MQKLRLEDFQYYKTMQTGRGLRCTRGAVQRDLQCVVGVYHH